ncbi:MAG: MoxR family ATPase [Nitrososphaerota archaeon]
MLSLSFVKELAEKLSEAVHEVIAGMDEVIHALIVALLAEGHVLIDGPPGIAKTYLARAFSSALALDFKRIQFTADILPSDIIGFTVYNRATNSFEFRRGPIFSNIVLADEINRAPPRSQSALLEAMQERQVTVEGIKYFLPRPFMIIATQNPIEFEGTYYLPEAELDRFLIRVVSGYPSREIELEMLSKKLVHGEKTDVRTIARAEDVLKAIELTSKVFVDRSIMEYIVNLAEATRRHERIALGVSPRGEVALLYASKAEAAINGKNYVIPDHVKSIMKLVFNHRVILKGGSMSPLESRNEIFKILDEVLEEVPAPR